LIKLFAQDTIPIIIRITMNNGLLVDSNSGEVLGAADSVVSTPVSFTTTSTTSASSSGSAAVNNTAGSNNLLLVIVLVIVVLSLLAVGYFLYRERGE
jgi:hypothetical protein